MIVAKGHVRWTRVEPSDPSGRPLYKPAEASVHIDHINTKRTFDHSMYCVWQTSASPGEEIHDPACPIAMCNSHISPSRFPLVQICFTCPPVQRDDKQRHVYEGRTALSYGRSANHSEESPDFCLMGKRSDGIPPWQFDYRRMQRTRQTTAGAMPLRPRVGYFNDESTSAL